MSPSDSDEDRYNMDENGFIKALEMMPKCLFQSQKREFSRYNQAIGNESLSSSALVQMATPFQPLSYSKDNASRSPG